MRGLVAAIATAGVFGVTIGLTMPLLALVLEGRGYGETLIGINSAATFVGILVLSPLASGLIRRIGLARAMLGGLLVCALCLLLLSQLDSYGGWLVVRFVFGGSEGVLFVAAETWINAAVADRLRSRMTAFYGTALALGFAGGPLLIATTGIEGVLPFACGAALTLAGLIPLAIGWGQAPHIDGAPSRGIVALMRLVPVPMAAAALFGLLDGGLLSLLAVFGLAIGLDFVAAAGLITVLVLGGITLQIPIAWLADRTDRRRVLAACGAVGAAALAAVGVFEARGFLLDGLLFVIGGMIGCYWVLGMTLVGERFTNADLAGATVGLTIAYGIGSVAGPAFGGLAMEFWGTNGLMLALALVTGAFTVFAIARGQRVE
jgi:MFS family permease